MGVSLPLPAVQSAAAAGADTDRAQGNSTKATSGINGAGTQVSFNLCDWHEFALTCSSRRKRYVTSLLAAFQSTDLYLVRNLTSPIPLPNC